MPCDSYEFPDAFEVDYGEPAGLCHLTSDGSGVFTRKWSKSVIPVDCNAYTSRIVLSCCYCAMCMYFDNDIVADNKEEVFHEHAIMFVRSKSFLSCVVVGNITIGKSYNETMKYTYVDMFIMRTVLPG